MSYKPHPPRTRRYLEQLDENTIHTRSTTSGDTLQQKKRKKTSSTDQERTFLKDDVARSFGVYYHEVKQILEHNTSEDDDPPFVFVWRDLGPFINAINGLGVGAPPCPFVLPFPLTSDTLKQALLQHLAPPGVQVRFGGLLACNGPQSCVASSRCTQLSAMPWALVVTGAMLPGELPIANVIVSISRSNDMAYATEAAPAGFAPLWR